MTWQMANRVVCGVRLLSRSERYHLDNWDRMSWASALIIINASRRRVISMRASSCFLPSVPAVQSLRTGPSYARRIASANIPRAFHATARREAFPLLPVLLLKSSSVLPASITIARVLLSFFPIISMVQFRMRKLVRRFEGKGPPVPSPVAAAFVEKWCPDEDGKRFTFLQITTMNRKERKALIRQVQDSPRKPVKLEGDGGLHFLLPALPPASLAEYTQLSTDEKEEIYLYRRYRASMRMAEQSLGKWRWIVVTLVAAPLIGVGVVMLAALERVPITGRWRFILLSPDEEDAISSNLVGQKWYENVISLLTTADAPAPPILPDKDWRWTWVADTLRKLEAAALADCASFEQFPEDTHAEASTALSMPAKTVLQAPLGPHLAPPPAEYPFKPRPRASASLHGVLPGGDSMSGKEHLQVGPPFSLLILSKEEANAFSYGFGGKGAGGIVVYTGLLDSILAADEAMLTIPHTRSLWQWFQSFVAGRPANPLRRQTTAEQDFQLAAVLAHELGHLLLSHHLETLSSRQVLWPSIIGLGTDIIRVVVWPITVLFGPLLNDGLSNVSKTSVKLLKERIDMPLNRIQETEADLVGLRILSRAGYDPEAAVTIWGDHVAHLTEASMAQSSSISHAAGTYQKHWQDPSLAHPGTQARIQAVREELARWRRRASS